MYILPVIIGWVCLIYLLVCYIKKKRPNAYILTGTVLAFIVSFFVWGFYLR